MIEAGKGQLGNIKGLWDPGHKYNRIVNFKHSGLDRVRRAAATGIRFSVAYAVERIVRVQGRNIDF